MDNQTHCEQDIDFDRGAYCFGPNDVCLFLSSSGALYVSLGREINKKQASNYTRGQLLRTF